MHLRFLIGNLHKVAPILFRCPKIRKTKYILNGIITHPSLKQNDNFEQVPVDLDVEFAVLGFGKTFCDRKTKSGTFCVS